MSLELYSVFGWLVGLLAVSCVVAVVAGIAIMADWITPEPRDLVKTKEPHE